MKEITINYPGTNNTFITVSVDDNNNINGKINIHDKSNVNNILQRMVVKDDKVLFSEIINGTTNMKLIGDSNKFNFILEKGGSKVTELLGLKKNGIGDLDFDGTTSTIFGNNFSISSTLIRNSSTINILSEMKLTTGNRLEIKSTYREVGSGNHILSSHFINETGVELIRKVYKNGNYLQPVFMVVKDITEDEIHGVYNGNQVPTLGTIENLS